MIFHGGRGSQEDASTFRSGESAILVVVVIVTPRDVVWDQIPGVIRVVLRGLGEGWADRRDGANRRDGGAMVGVDIQRGFEACDEIERKDGEVISELCTVVLDFEGGREERHREGHWLRARGRGEDEVNGGRGANI